MTSPGTPALECSCHPWEKAPLDPTSYENELREAQDGPAQAVCVIPGLVGEQEKGWYSWNNWYLSQALPAVVPSLILTEDMWTCNT